MTTWTIVAIIVAYLVVNYVLAGINNRYGWPFNVPFALYDSATSSAKTYKEHLESYKSDNKSITAVLLFMVFGGIFLIFSVLVLVIFGIYALLKFSANGFRREK